MATVANIESSSAWGGRSSSSTPSPQDQISLTSSCHQVSSFFCLPLLWFSIEPPAYSRSEPIHLLPLLQLLQLLRIRRRAVSFHLSKLTSITFARETFQQLVCTIHLISRLCLYDSETAADAEQMLLVLRVAVLMALEEARSSTQSHFI